MYAMLTIPELPGPREDLMPVGTRLILRLAATAAICAPVAAFAAPIGNAIAVKPDAQAEGARGTLTLATGTGVESNDKIITGLAGSTRLRFLDQSTLDVGAGANVTLDSFVYKPDNTASQASLSMMRGTFRWVSGKSAKDAYDLKTPHATIGIRGTDIRVMADLTSTTIMLNSGAFRACSRITGRCADATRRGHGVRIHEDGRIETLNGSRMEQQQQQSPPVRRASVTPPDDDDDPPPRRAKPRRDGGGPAARPPRRAAQPIYEDDDPPPRRTVTRQRQPRVVYVEEEEVYYPPRPRGPTAGEVLGGVIGIGIGIAGSGILRPPKRRPPMGYPQGGGRPPHEPGMTRPPRVQTETMRQPRIETQVTRQPRIVNNPYLNTPR